MEKALDTIFTSIQKDLQTNLLAAAPAAGQANGGGSIDFDFTLDANGNYRYKIDKYGVGVTVKCIAWINQPSGSYNLTITSSDGGGGQWNDIQSGHHISFNIQTSFWHSTAITIALHGKPNVSGTGALQYSY